MTCLIDSLPPPSAAALKITQQLQQRINDEILSAGPMSFARYMDLALYCPGLGYYSNATEKFGAQGDFITAPEISSLFGSCIAQQIAEIIATMPENGAILEFGAGSGRLAGDIIAALKKLKTLPDRYYILELSATLRHRQQDYLKINAPDFFEKIVWLDHLPLDFQGVIIANEVLDAMPVHRFCWEHGQLWEYQIDAQNEQLIEVKKPASSLLSTQVSRLEMSLNSDYHSEINLALSAWIAALSQFLTKGVVLLIDYGFPRHEYYHPQRSMGTLMCHYQHRAHSQALLWPGLQDITAHVDFTAVAEAAVEHGLEMIGYTNQANFLLSCGILEIAAQMELDTVAHYETSQQLKRLLLPSEMGELFKVMALSKQIDVPLLGFKLNDISEKL